MDYTPPEKARLLPRPAWYKRLCLIIDVLANLAVWFRDETDAMKADLNFGG